LDAFIDDIDVVRRARRRRVRITSDVPAGQSGLVANTQLASFTIIEAQVTHDETQPLTAEQAESLGVADGDTIVTYIFEVPRD
jgi:arginine/ornithine N-succinyltransferase beta subunit